METINENLTTVAQKHEFKFEEYLVFYFDILGQKELLKNLKVDDHGNNGDVNKIFSCIVEFNARMNRLLKKAKELSLNLIEGSTIFATEDDKRKVLNSIEQMEVGLQQFSDLTMIYVKIGTPAVWFISFIILLEISTLMTFQMANGFIVRGSVVRGMGCKLENNCLYGPVLYEANEIETQIAQWGRMVFSLEAYKFFKEITIIARRCGIKEDSDIVYGIENLIKKDIDGALYLDYLAPEMMRFFKKQGLGSDNVLEAQKAGLKYIVEQKKKFGDTDDALSKGRKLALRYKIMEYYWISRMNEWSDEEKVRKILGE